MPTSLIYLGHEYEVLLPSVKIFEFRDGWKRLAQGSTANIANGIVAAKWQRQYMGDNQYDLRKLGFQIAGRLWLHWTWERKQADLKSKVCKSVSAVRTSATPVQPASPIKFLLRKEMNITQKGFVSFAVLPQLLLRAQCLQKVNLRQLQ